MLIFQFAGEFLGRLFNLPVPGPVLGMLFLVAALYLNSSVPEELTKFAKTILQHLSLLFVPAGVGAMIHIGLISKEWFAIIVTLFISIVLTLLITSLAMRFLLGLTKVGNNDKHQ